MHCDANAFVSPVTRSGKSNKFGQMQELTNENYSEIKLCSIFRIEYKAIGFSTNKKPQIEPLSLTGRSRTAEPEECVTHAFSCDTYIVMSHPAQTL